MRRLGALLGVLVIALIPVACDRFEGATPAWNRAEGGVAQEEAREPIELARPVEPEMEEPIVSDAELRRLAQPARNESVCRTFARKVAEAALDHPADPDAFVVALTEEFVGGTDDPFELKAGLRDGTWNQRYFYAGHGGFRPEYDDAQRYAAGGNHQPGHFVSVFAIAARFGEEQARLAIAYAGDYDPGDEDDLRLSNVAIPLGSGLTDRSVSPAEVAVRARELCRS